MSLEKPVIRLCRLKLSRNGVLRMEKTTREKVNGTTKERVQSDNNGSTSDQNQYKKKGGKGKFVKKKFD